ncbi:MAG: TetR/AcrR family transcriptional regulator [Bacteroidia bacterium]|jgi:AcrR family transcriptional regulator
MSDPLVVSRKHQILQTASRLFREKGYTATTMRDIASAMHIEAASLYHHIRSKEELLDTICFEMADKFITALKEVNDIYFDAEQRLRMAITFHVQIMTGNMDQSAVFLNEWRSLPEDKLEAFKKLRNQYENEFRIIVSDGKKEDIFDDVDEKLAALTILSAVNWIYQWYNPAGKMSPGEIADQLSNLLLSGIRKKLIIEPGYKV